MLNSYYVKINWQMDGFNILKNMKTSIEMVDFHVHESYEIYYLISGERNYLIGDRTYKVPAGSLVFVPPHEIHRTTKTNVPIYERIVFNFTEQFLGSDKSVLKHEFSPFYTHTYVLKLPIHLQKKVEELLYRMITEYETQDTGSGFKIKAALLNLIVLSLRQNRDTLHNQMSFQSAAQHRIYQIMRYINEHYSNRLTLEVLADQFHLSTFYLSRSFKKETGFTVTDYLGAVRIKAAQKLLRETNWKLNRVMEEVGFGDYSYFGKLFKKISQCTPREYRKMQRY